jgi:hypothetical protein
MEKLDRRCSDIQVGGPVTGQISVALTQISVAFKVNVPSLDANIRSLKVNIRTSVTDIQVGGPVTGAQNMQPATCNVAPCLKLHEAAMWTGVTG